MSHIITDGTGAGYNVKVNESNELHVKPFPIDIHSRSQLTGRAFGLYMKRDIATANTEEPIGSLKYDGAGRLVISDLAFSMSFTDISEVQGGRIEVHIIDGQTLSNGTARTPINLNRASNNASDTTCLSGEGTLISGFTIDATTEIFHAQLMTSGNTNWEWNTGDALLLEQNNQILITAKGFTSGTSLPGFRCTMRFFEEDLDTI